MSPQEELAAIKVAVVAAFQAPHFVVKTDTTLDVVNNFIRAYKTCVERCIKLHGWLERREP